MSENKTPVIGHVTPLADGAEKPPMLRGRDGALRPMTRGADGIYRPGPAVDVGNCPSNECQIRRQYTRTLCMTLGEPPPAMHDLDAGDGARSWMSIPSLDPSTLRVPQDATSGVGAVFGTMPELPEPERAADPTQDEERAALSAEVRRLWNVEAERDELMAYIDEAKRALGEDRVSGEPLAQAIVGIRADLANARGEIQGLEARVADLVAQRNAYRDRMRTMLGVTRPDGEELIALVERKAVDIECAVGRLAALTEPLRRAAKLLGADASGASLDLAHAIEAAAGKLAEQRTAGATLTARLYELALRLGARLPKPEERYAEDAVSRIERGVVDMQHAQGKAERSRDVWRARARKAEGKRGKMPASARKGGRR